ncbi:MAG: hypothetical protein H6721_01860 [Sandaracinus sp.]|nr:hypothetical protein [Sandaracinus sp.]MCB9611186.1 hypothetical protein [Sandaracinus sp.]MCB9621062.1 hypothetical protein [Sandaracinus sp.]MCB9623727.1 hypothetical protein [Sandaracinus sp.]MCB9630888.1 hypothetical protein [Sandaracinus sp.]
MSGRTRRGVGGLAWLLGVVGVLGLGCSDGQKSYAEETVRLTSRALLDVETSGGESPEVVEALRDAHDWLAPTEAAIEMWAEGGDAAYERVAPCLGATLTVLRQTLMAGGAEVPPSLEQAEEQAHGASEAGCVRDGS